jgi:Peptidase family M48
MTLQVVHSGASLALELGLMIYRNLATHDTRDDCPERKQLYADFFRNIGITEHLVLAEEDSLLGFCGHGNNLTGRASICMPPGLFNLDPDAYGFILKHEAGHVVANDMITIPMGSLIASVASKYFCHKKKLGFFSKSVFDNIVRFLSLAALYQWRESKADDFAIRHSTDRELLGGIRFFQVIKKISKGHFNIDFFHPSLSSRIEKISNELKKRGAGNFVESYDSSYEYSLAVLLKSSQEGGVRNILKQLEVVQSFFMNFFPAK